MQDGSDRIGQKPTALPSTWPLQIFNSSLGNLTMQRLKIDTKILACAIARAKGTKPETYLRKMSSLKHVKTGRVMRRKSRHAIPYPQYAIRVPLIHRFYVQMVRRVK